MTDPSLPPVSVILPVRNGMPHLPAAVDSVLSQDHGDLELLVLDDGSTDGTAAYLRSLTDPRLRVLRHDASGLVAGLNALLAAAQHDLVARMDADDLSRPHRLAAQVQLMSARPDLVAVGSCYGVLGEAGDVVGTAHVPLDSAYVRRVLLLRNPVGHGAVVLRRQAVLDVGGYRADVGPVEDYDLWCRLAEVGDVANLTDPLYDYRLSEHGVTRSAIDHQRRCSWAVRDDYRARVDWPTLGALEVLRQGRRHVAAAARDCDGAARQYGFDHLNLAQAALRSGRVVLAVRLLVGSLLFVASHPSAAGGLVPVAELRRARARRQVDRALKP